MHTVLLASASDFFGNLGGILAGISELLLALGAGIGFVVRSRRSARRERLRTETAASLAAQEARKVLEERLEKQHHDQIEDYKKQIADLTSSRDQLLSRLLEGHKDDT